MDPENTVIDSEVHNPMLVIPKKYLQVVSLVTGSEVTENIVIDLKITSAGSEGNNMCIYSGYCNVKLVDTNDGGLQPTLKEPEILDNTIDNSTPIVITDLPIMDPSFNKSQVWIDPDQSSSVYNHYEHPQERCSIQQQTKSSCITHEKQGFYITQNICNFEESIRYSRVEEYEHKKFKKIHGNDQCNQNSSDPNNLNLEDDELECAVFLSQLPEEIMNEKENKAREEWRFLDDPNKQDSQCGQTIQNIALNNPLVECSTSKDNFDVIFEEGRNPNQKKYQCNNCKQIFDQLSAFKQHFKAFSRKIELRAHALKTHKMFICEECDFIFEKNEDLAKHIMLRHATVTEEDKDTSETEFAGLYIEIEVLSEKDLIIPSPAPLEDIPKAEADDTRGHTKDERCDAGDVIAKDGRCDADDVIAKVMANENFLLNSKKARLHRKNNKACEVCHKHFNRIGDLKIHLIEHVVRSTLSKTPVGNEDGKLNITCEVCHVESFRKVDKYKAHLREHAKLTLYRCTFCDKSFSDSSNFSKHKKIHGSKIPYLQCDLCQRKFYSKKMIAQHMEYHKKNAPLKCESCDRVFHFKSMLKKHIKGAHTKELTSRYRCLFCLEYFRSVKEKWDHEWSVHNVRKKIVDCLICGSKFRKYADLKLHCRNIHGMEIPSAKKLVNIS